MMRPASATGNYRESARILAAVSVEERIGIGGSNVERELAELIEKAARARPDAPISPRRH